MTERELNIALREMARNVGLCDKWYAEWGDECTVDECLDKYVRGFDFAADRDWPSLEFSRENFRKEDLRRHNIYLDEDVSIDADNGYYVFLGKSVATVYVTGFKAVTIFCRHNSVVNVEARDGARVFITYYDRSTGGCKSDEYSKIRTYNVNRK